MRKIILFFVLLTIPLFVLLYFIFRNQTTAPSKSLAWEAEKNTASSFNGMDLDRERLYWQKIDDTDNLKLIPNFGENRSSGEVFDKNYCKFLSSAGFYDKDGKPIGLFVTDSNQLNPWQKNSLFDGVLSINDIATPRITRDVPRDHLRIALQSGPILKENGSFLDLGIQNDVESRRVLAGVTGGNELYIIVVYNKDSEYLGPKLADLPRIMERFEAKSGIVFADLINLDGGSASAYRNSEVNLSELTGVGAFFCQL